MQIKTSAGLWKFPELLSLAHRANEAIEREAGPRSGSLAVVWELAGDDNADAYLKVTVMLRGECLPVVAEIRRIGQIEALRRSCHDRFSGVEEKRAGWSAR